MKWFTAAKAAFALLIIIHKVQPLPSEYGRGWVYFGELCHSGRKDSKNL